MKYFFFRQWGCSVPTDWIRGDDDVPNSREALRSFQNWSEDGISLEFATGEIQEEDFASDEEAEKFLKSLQEEEEIE